MNETRLYLQGLKTFKAEGYNGLKLINKHSMLERLNGKILSRLACFVVIVAIVMIIFTAGCGNEALIYTTDTEEISEITEVTLDEDLSGNSYLITNRALPIAEQEKINYMILSNNIFAFELYQQLNKKEHNLFFSPYIVSRVMAIAYTGAHGETANQILDVFRFDTEQDRLHEVFNSLDYLLNFQDSSAQISPEEQPLQTASAAWGQIGYSVPIDFYNILSAYYCDPIEALDFKYSSADAENVIETWVSTQTDKLIANAASSVTDRVRLAFASTITMNSNWAQPFDPDSTADGPFKLLNGSIVTVPRMSQTGYFPFTRQEEEYEAIELKFDNSTVSMLLLIPEEENFHEFDKAIDCAVLDDIVNRLEPEEIELTLPCFSFTSGEGLNDTFSELGITDSLIEGQADFSGINKADDLYLNGSNYKAHIDLAELGMQGGSSTVLTLEGRDEIPEQGPGGIVIHAYSAIQSPYFEICWPQPIEVTLSRPFIFVLRDTVSGAIVFLGKVMNPKN